MAPKYGLGSDESVVRLLSRMHDRPFKGQRPVRAGPSHPWDDRQDRGMVARTNKTTKTTVGIQKVSMKPATGVKDKQAWMYPGGNILRAPGLVINDRYYSDHKEADAATWEEQCKKQGEPGKDGGENTGQPRRKHESNFFITINPNKKVPKEGGKDAKAREAFKKADKHLRSDDVLARCLKFGPKHDWYMNDRAVDVIVPGIQWQSSVEVGEKQGKMHTHIWVTIEHYSQIQINVRMMQYEFMTAYNAAVGADPELVITTRPYLQVKLLPQSNWTTIMRQYIQKGMEQNQKETEPAL